MRKIDNEYLHWIATHQCCAPSELAGGRPCVGEVEPHHTTGKGMGGSKRDDRDSVPLCRGHHVEWHTHARLSPWEESETKVNLKDMAFGYLKRYLDGISER